MKNSSKIIHLFLFVIIFSSISVFSVAKTKVAMLYSELSEKNLTTNQTWVLEEITAWELFMMQSNIAYEVIYDNDIDFGIEDEFDILILPSVEIISQKQFDVLKGFLISGKSIICADSKLQFAENSIDDFSNLKNLFDLGKITSVPVHQQSFIHTVTSNHFNKLTANRDMVLQISNKNSCLVIDDNQIKYELAGYILSEDEFNFNKSSIIYGTISSGKFVWTGFGINDIIGGNEDINQFQEFILDVIGWMDLERDVYLDVEFNKGLKPAIFTVVLNNALESELIDVLNQNNFNPNLIVDPKQITSKEIIGKFNSESIILDLTTLAEIESDLKTFSQVISNFNAEFGVTICTIIIENSLVNKIDFTSFRDLGIKNILILSNENEDKIRFASDIFVSGFNRNRFYSYKNGNVRYVYVTPQNNCDINFEDELFANLSRIHPEELRFSNFNEISKWVKLKTNLFAQIKDYNENQIDVLITNKNLFDLENLEIYFNPGINLNSDRLRVFSNTEPIDYIYQRNIGLFKINLNQLNANSSKKISITIIDE